jgi:hypothetical protein
MGWLINDFGYLGATLFVGTGFIVCAKRNKGAKPKANQGSNLIWRTFIEQWGEHRNADWLFNPFCWGEVSMQKQIVLVLSGQKQTRVRFLPFLQ